MCLLVRCISGCGGAGAAGIMTSARISIPHRTIFFFIKKYFFNEGDGGWGDLGSGSADVITMCDGVDAHERLASTFLIQGGFFFGKDGERAGDGQSSKDQQAAQSWIGIVLVGAFENLLNF